MGILGKAKYAAVSRALDYIEEDPEQNIPATVKWLEENNIGGTGAESMVGTAAKICADPDSENYKLLFSLWQDIDPGMRRSLLENLIVSAGMIGSKRRRENEERHSCLVPRAIMIEPKDGGSELSSGDIERAISLGCSLGAFVHVFDGACALERIDTILRMSEKHKDATFAVTSDPALITCEIAERMKRARNVVPVLLLNNILSGAAATGCDANAAADADADESTAAGCDANASAAECADADESTAAGCDANASATECADADGDAPMQSRAAGADFSADERLRECAGAMRILRDKKMLFGVEALISGEQNLLAPKKESSCDNFEVEQERAETKQTRANPEHSETVKTDAADINENDTANGLSLLAREARDAGAKFFWIASDETDPPTRKQKDDVIAFVKGGRGNHPILVSDLINTDRREGDSILGHILIKVHADGDITADGEETVGGNIADTTIISACRKLAPL